MKYTFLIIAIGLLPLAQAVAEPELKGSPAELSAYLATLPKLVSVSGEAEIKVPADRALVSLRVRTENKSLQEAMRLNQDIREKVAVFLSGRGVEANRIQSSRFASAQRFGIFSDKAKSHQVEQYLKITVRDEKEFQTVASTVDKWAEVHYGGTEFEHSEKEAFKSKALVQACEQATDRKRLLEERLGVKLIPKRFTQDTVAHISRNTQAGEYSGSKDLRKTSSLPETAPASYAAMVDEGQSAFGELVYTAQVTVEYALESK